MKTASSKATKVWAAVVLCAAFAACTTRRGDREHENAPPSAAPTLAPEGVGKALDLASVMRRAHFRFRPERDGFRAQQDAYDARVNAVGALSVGAGATTLRLTTIAAGDARAVAARDGGVQIARDRCVTEHAVGAEGGIEQSWIYECAPPAGDVVVRVAASGPPFASSDERGLLFRDGPATGHHTGIRYGAATWVDARGARTPVRPEWADGVITLRVPAEVVARSAFPATLDPLVGPELMIDKEKTVTVPSTQDHPAVAFNGTNYFVVWDDRRSGDSNVYGARINPATGAVLDEDRNGVPIAVLPSDQTIPAVASNGADFFVVWEDIRTGTPRLFGARVLAATGQVPDPDVGGIALGGGVAGQRLPSVAWDGKNYFVVWEDARTPPNDVYGLRVSPDGKPLPADANGIAISTALYGQNRPRVACDGTRCLVVWSDNREAKGLSAIGKYDIYGARVVSATGAVVDNEPNELKIAVGPSSQTNPSLAYDKANNQYLVVWDDFESPTAEPDIAGRRFNGTTLASLDATPISIATGPQAQRGPAVAFDGKEFLVTWTNAVAQPTIRAAVVKSDGSRVPGSPGGVELAVPALFAGTSDVAGGTFADRPGFFAAWTEARSASPADVHGARVDATATPLDRPAVVITGHANVEMAPAVASDGKDYFVVWEDWRRSSPGDVFGARMDASGVVPASDQAGVLIAEAATPGSASARYHVQPAVAFGAGTYLVAWTDRHPPEGLADGDIVSVKALRFDPASGKTVAADKTGVRISGLTPVRIEQTAPALAFTGGTFLAAWRDGRHGSDQVYVRPIKVGAVNLELAPEVRIGEGPLASTAPRVAGDGAQTFLVAWQDFRDELKFVTYAARVDLTGKVRDGDAGGFRVSQVAAEQLSPSVAWSGSDFVVVWEDHRSQGAQGEIFGRRIPLAGPPTTDDIPISVGSGPGTGRRQSPFVVNALDGVPGGNLQVVWRDERGGQWDLFGSVVGGNGVVREPAGLPIALEAGEKASPAMAANGSGDMLLAYSRVDPGSAFRVARARARILSTGIATGPCTKDDECSTRFCTDGVCCSERCDAPCRTCSTGTCSLVTNAQDDQCNGASSCSATGVCQRSNGQPCALASQCASGVCDAEEAVCCDRACAGACNTCKSREAPGICTIALGGTVPQECVPFACDGKNEQCPTACESDVACARPNVCLPPGKCEPLLASTCIDTKTIKAPSGLVTDCTPYACAGAACVNPCKSVHDCVSGFVCDIDGKCVEPPAPANAGGCACHATSSGPRHGHAAWLAAALLAVVRLRRRSSPAR